MDKQEQRPKLPGEGVFGIILLLLSLVFVWQSYAISGFSALSSPGAFPLAASAIMAIAALMVVIGDLRRPSVSEDQSSPAKARSFSAQITPTVVVVFSGLVIAYAALLNVLGFLPSSFLFLFVAIHFLHRGSAAFSLIVTLSALIVIYVIFRLVFTVVLPEGIVPEREIMAQIAHFFGQLFGAGEISSGGTQ